MALDPRQDSYNQSVGIIIDMDDMVDILPVDDVPFQQWVPNGPAAESTKVEWLNEELTGQVVTVASTSTTTSTTITVESGDGDLLRAGDVLAQEFSADAEGVIGEQVLVVSVSNDTVTVSRAFGSTSGVQLVAGDKLAIIGQYRDEGSDPEDPRFTDRTSDYNYTQIDQEAVNASRTTQQVKRYGMGNPLTHEQSKKFREIAIRHERRLILGRRVQSGKKRSMGGVFYYATENGNASGAKATLAADTNKLLRACWNAGGAPKTIWVSADAKELYDALNADRLVTPSDTTYQAVVTRFKSSFGDVDIRFSRYVPRQKVIAVDQNFARHRTLQGYAFQALAKTGDADNGQIICEKSFELKNPKAHGVLTIEDL